MNDNTTTHPDDRDLAFELSQISAMIASIIGDLDARNERPEIQTAITGRSEPDLDHDQRAIENSNALRDGGWDRLKSAVLVLLLAAAFGIGVLTGMTL